MIQSNSTADKTLEQQFELGEQETSLRKISVVIITQDEEERIGNAICSCQSFADEIIVIDGGSKDATVERVQELGCNLYINPWPGYAQQRIFGIEKASNAWIFMIDSDEMVGKALAASLLKWKQIEKLEADAFSVDRVGDFLGKWLTNHADHQIRLFNRQVFQIAPRLVHEGILPGDAPVVRLTGVLWHTGFRSLSSITARFNKYTDLEAQRDALVGKRFNFARLLLKPPARFVQRYFLQGLYRRGLAGFSCSVLWIFYDFLKEMKLYEIAWKEAGGESQLGIPDADRF